MIFYLMIYLKISIMTSLNEGNKFIEEMLKDYSEEQISAKNIVNALNNKTLLNDLLQKAQMTLKAKRII